MSITTLTPKTISDRYYVLRVAQLKDLTVSPPRRGIPDILIFRGPICIVEATSWKEARTLLNAYFAPLL